MAGKSFDKIIYKPDFEKNKRKLTEELWQIIESHIEYLKSEEYFRLTSFFK